MRLVFWRIPAHWMPRIGIGLAVLAILAMATVVLHASQDVHPKRSRSLMQLITQWKYPGSTLQGGASMGDGGNRSLQSGKCKAILTTPDPIDRVIAYYAEKFEVPPVPEPGGNGREGDARSVATQNDSQGRPVTIRILVVNTADASTTLVISRDEGEKETHIAWLHYFRLDTP
jgi:hypothetical protein